MTRGVAVLAVVASLSACWLQVGYGPEHQRHNDFETGLTTANVSTLARAWSVDLPAGASEPMVRDGRVYVNVSSRSGTRLLAAVHAYDLATGSEVWSTDYLSIETPPFLAFFNSVPVSFVGDQLVAGYGYEGDLGANCASVVLDPATGDVVASEQEWAYSPRVHAGSITAQVTVDDGPGCGGNAESKLVVRDSTSREVLWTSDLPDSTLGSTRVPTVVDGKIYVAGLVFEAQCAASTCPGQALGLGTETPIAVPVTGSSTGKLIVVSDDVDGASLTAIPREPEATGWFARSVRGARFAVAGELIYSRQAGIQGLEVFDANAPEASCHYWCVPIWHGSSSRAASGSAPVVAGGVVYLGSAGAIDAFAAAGCGSDDCAPLVSVPVAGSVTNLSVAQGRVFATVSSVDGHTLTAFAPSGG